ncbi:hypothetical protein B0H11DRAFT_2214722 [Mycena galericulata]|nr:hypothetical protein B0H11DRAFT_2214722 [Mycena galericulata]
MHAAQSEAGARGGPAIATPRCRPMSTWAQGHILEAHADRVREPFPDAEEEYAPMGRNLFVRNLPFDVQWQDLENHADNSARALFYEYSGRTLNVHYDKLSHGTQ